MMPDILHVRNRGAQAQKLDLTRYVKSRREVVQNMLAYFPGGLRLLGSAVKSSTIVSVAWRTVDARCKNNDIFTMAVTWHDMTARTPSVGVATGQGERMSKD
jgi:hypothetical protein